jgi:hypothetical protein
MDAQAVEVFRKRLFKMNPRTRRGFLDSLYAGLIRGRRPAYEVLESVVGLLYFFGFCNHATKLMAGTYYPSIIGLEVDDIGRHHMGPAKGYDTLSLGMRIVRSGPGWSAAKPTAYCLVPTGTFCLGEVVKAVPNGTLPVSALFPKG